MAGAFCGPKGEGEETRRDCKLSADQHEIHPPYQLRELLNGLRDDGGPEEPVFTTA